MPKSNVLVFPCGSEIGLEVYKSLRFSKDLKLFGGSSTDDHGKFTYENYIPGMPYIENDNFIDHLNDIIKEYSIDYIIPAHDSVVVKLAECASSLAAVVVSSPVDTCVITRSKAKTYTLLKDKILTPRVFSDKSEITEFPVFLKPDVGQGSKGTMKANDHESVDRAVKIDPSLLILEYLPGAEYTVDCFTGRNGELLYAQPRERARISNGISVNSRPVADEEFKPIADTINQTLEFSGAWFFQVKRNRTGELVLMEIAPRIAGTMALSRMKGVNLPLLSVYVAQGIEVSIINNSFDLEIDRALVNRFRIDINFDKVYVDFDDTLILDDKVNYFLLAFLYKMVNEKKKIILITKHALDIRITLEKFSIAEDLFDEIIHIKKLDQKSEYINNLNSIFIDDSFSERMKIHKDKGIPVFDVSEIAELL